MNYRITFEDYLSLINSNELDIFYIYEQLFRSQIISNSKANLMKFYHHFGGALDFNEYSYNKLTKKLEIRKPDNFHLPILIEAVSPTKSPTKFTSKLLEITKLQEGDLEALNLFCCSFMKEFGGINFCLSLWGKIDNVKISGGDDGGMWHYIESPELNFSGYFDKDKELLVSYKGEHYPYDKFKNLKAFL